MTCPDCQKLPHPCPTHYATPNQEDDVDTEIERLRGAIHNAWNSLQSGEKATALEYLRAAFNGQPPPPDYLKKANEELGAKLSEAQGRSEALEWALGSYVDKTAPAVAVLSRAPEVAPEIRAELAAAERILLGQVKDVLSGSVESRALSERAAQAERERDERWTFDEVCWAIDRCETGHMPPDDRVPCDFKSLAEWLPRARVALSSPGSRKGDSNG